MSYYQDSKKIEKNDFRKYIDRMAEDGGQVTNDGGQVMDRIGCTLDRRGWKWWKGS